MVSSLDRALNRGHKQTDVIMDFAQAFDKVSHRRLLYKLDYYPTYYMQLVIFDCLTNFPSLPVRSGFDELFPVTTFLTVSQSHDTLASMFLYIT